MMKIQIKKDKPIKGYAVLGPHGLTIATEHINIAEKEGKRLKRLGFTYYLTDCLITILYPIMPKKRSK